LDVVGDVRGECEKFGVVEKILMLRNIKEGKNDPPDAKLREIGPQIGGDAVGNIYVLFKQTEDCEKAQKALHQRWFGGRRIEASFYDEKKFQQGTFS